MKASQHKVFFSENNKELYYVEDNTINPETVGWNFIPVYAVLKDESLVTNKENLRPFFLKGENEFKDSKLKFKHMATLNIFRQDTSENDEASLTFLQGQRNPFLEDFTLPVYHNNRTGKSHSPFFATEDKIKNEETVIPFFSVLYYKTNIYNGAIESLHLFLNNGHTMILTNMEHKEYLEQINNYNNWITEKMAGE